MRYDDPLDIYPVVYAGSTLLGAFVEKLQPLRPSPAMRAALARIRNNAPGLTATPPAGTVFAAWLRKLYVGRGRLTGTFVDVTQASTLALLDRSMRGTLGRLRVRRLDLSAVTSGKRKVTQEISRWVYERRTRDDRPFDGILYTSRFGANLECWAIFDRKTVQELPSKHFRLHNAALAQAKRKPVTLPQPGALNVDAPDPGQDLP